MTVIETKRICQWCRRERHYLCGGSTRLHTTYGRNVPCGCPVDDHPMRKLLEQRRRSREQARREVER